MLLLTKKFKLIGFPIFWVWEDMINVIPENFFFLSQTLLEMVLKDYYPVVYCFIDYVQ